MTTARFTAARFSSPKILLVLGFFALSSVFLLGVGRSPVPSLPVVNAQGKCSILPDNSKLPDATVGVPYTQIFSGANGTLPYTFMLSGNLLPGLKFTNSGIGGTPTKAGSVSINVQMSDSAVSPCTTAKAYNLTVLPDPNCPDEIILSPAAGTLRPGVATVNYSVTFTVSGGQTPYVFTVDGNTPDGLTLAPSGELTGTPTRTGKFDFTVQAKDNKGCIGTADYSISIADAGSIDTQAPTVKVLSPANGESIPSGTSFGIAWQADDNVGVDKQDVSFSSDDGLTFPLSIAANLDGTARDFQWSVPKDLRTTRGRVRVTATDATGNSGSATSGRIAITGLTDTLPPSISLVSPNANIPDQSIFPNDGKKKEDPKTDDPIKIEWSAADDTGIAGFDITATTKPLMNGGGPADSFPIVIAASVAGDKRSFNWVPGPSINSDTVSIRITVRDTSGNTAQTVSSRPFAVRPRPVVRAIEYFCAQVMVYGDNFNPRTLVSLNEKFLSPFRGLVKFQPLPSPDPNKGSQVMIIERKGKVAPGTNNKGKFDDRPGAVNTVFVNTDGLFSTVAQAIGDGPKPPRVQITAPARDAKFPPGTEITIAWNADTKCKVETQRVFFVVGHNGSDAECGVTDPKLKRDILIGNFDGTVRSVKWTVPQTFKDFGRLFVEASNAEGTSQDVVGTGNPRSLKTELIVTSPTTGTSLVADGKTPVTISWTYNTICAGNDTFQVQFTADNGGQASTTVKGSSFAGPLPFSFVSLLGDFTSLAGTLRVTALDSTGTFGEVKNVTLSAGGGGSGPQIRNILIGVNPPRPIGNQFGVISLSLTTNEQATLTWQPDPVAPAVKSYKVEYANDPLFAPQNTILLGDNLSQPQLMFLVSKLPTTAFNQGAVRITAIDNQNNSYATVAVGITVQPYSVILTSPRSVLRDPIRINIQSPALGWTLVGSGPFQQEIQTSSDFSFTTPKKINNGNLTTTDRTYNQPLVNVQPGPGFLRILVRDNQGNLLGEDRVPVIFVQ
ncbi:MAG: putative Ig domain-containing protein [Blastocatellia bacterium]|nr:putative Ig domain-containing protein [Blastocatellia bacterium]